MKSLMLTMSLLSACQAYAKPNEMPTCESVLKTIVGEWRRMDMKSESAQMVPGEMILIVYSSSIGPDEGMSEALLLVPAEHVQDVSVAEGAYLVREGFCTSEKTTWFYMLIFRDDNASRKLKSHPKRAKI